MPKTYPSPFFLDNFQLKVKSYPHQTKLFFQLFNPPIHTSALPYTCFILEHFLPGLCHHKCHNDKQFSFLREVKNTEIGHLFEHIVLEYLYLLKKDSHHHRPIHKGETVWDWNKEKQGTFHITIDIGSDEINTLTQALDKGIKLLRLIIQPKNQGDGSAPHLLVNLG